VYRLILALILLGFAAVAYQGVAHVDREAASETAATAAPDSRP
jgi:hypothetical protein